jgi:hypothetical protein
MMMHCGSGQVYVRENKLAKSGVLLPRIPARPPPSPTPSFTAGAYGKGWPRNPTMSYSSTPCGRPPLKRHYGPFRPSHLFGYPMLYAYALQWQLSSSQPVIQECNNNPHTHRGKTEGKIPMLENLPQPHVLCAQVTNFPMCSVPRGSERG